jgi:hypothetical protein
MGRHRGPCAALWAALALPAVAGAEPSADVPQSALHACAIIAAPSERLSCYDQLSARDVQSTAQPPSAAAATPVAGASPAVPAAAAVPPVATGASPVGAAAPAAAAPPMAPATPSRESFGLYAAEHPAAPPAPSTLRARVISVGGGASGRMKVELEGGQLWELEDADPLLAAGDLVSIRRAALGSFMLETPTRRTHRARRLL